MFDEQNTDPSSSRIINGSLITPPLGQANRINPLNQEEASRAKLRLNKVKNIKTAYRISVDSRQNNFILFHCPLDGEPSKT